MQLPRKTTSKYRIPGMMRGLGAFSLVASLSLGLLGSVITATAATSVAQYGITWTFSADRPVGQFANGDWWVVGPVTISNISPKTGDGGINDSHGSMLNPIPGQTQGLYKNGADNNPENSPKYDAAKNISIRLPYTVQAGNSVYSTMNNPDTWVQTAALEKTWFKETAVLTVVAAAPPAGSFRPPYAGTDKTIKSNWTISNLNYSALRSLAIPVPANAPSMTWLEEATRRPLLEMNFSYLNSNWKASWAENKPGGYPRRTYGREIAHIASGAGLMLNTNLSNAAKQKLLINMVQWGIDTHGLLKAGMQWQPNGGHNLGRLLPIYIAGKALNDPEILAGARGSSPFQETINHAFITKAHVDTPRAAHTPPFKPFTTDMIGMPEWSSSGQGPYTSSEWTSGDSGTWWGVPYRHINGAPNCGTVAAILLMGGRSEVNQEAFFSYHVDRFYPRERPGGNGAFSGDGNGIQFFVRDMWDVHINGGTPPPYVPPVEPPPVVTTFAVGDRIQVWGKASVNATASAATVLGYQDAPNLGTIVEGPSAADGQGVIWYRINYDNGVDGWTSKIDFIKSQSPNPSTFQVGDRIKVWRSTWANSTPSVTTGIGTNAAESAGVIVEGPTSNGTDNIVWFRVNYDSGFDGWSGADNFVKLSSGSPLSPPSGLGEGVALWSFEDGMNGWTVNSGFEHCISSPSRFAADGLGLVALNSGNFAPSAVLTRTLATTPGKTYVINFKIGVQAYNQDPQALRLKVIGTSTLAETTSTINGDGLAISRWENGQTATFVATGTSVVVEFKDVSTSTQNIDVLLDEIQVVRLD